LVRKRGRISVITFVLFWIVSLALIVGTELLDAPATVEMFVVALVLLMALLSIIFHLSTRCPICQYRLGYQRSLGCQLDVNAVVPSSKGRLERVIFDALERIGPG
jgi:hypothetical protein